MFAGRWVTPLLAALLASLPIVQAVCDVVCVPAEAAAHCAEHDPAQSPAPAESPDGCRHEHGGSTFVADRTSGTDRAETAAILESPVDWASPVLPQRPPEISIERSRPGRPPLLLALRI